MNTCVLTHNHFISIFLIHVIVALTCRIECNSIHPVNTRKEHTEKKIRIVGNLCYYQKPFWVSERFGNLLKEFPNGSETQKGF
jgi:hypothetical protein